MAWDATEPERAPRRTQYRLVLLALPVVALVLLLRWLLHQVLGYTGLLSFGDASGVVTGATIIVGLMLAGVVGDYKESEKLPSTVAISLLGLADLVRRGLELKDSASPELQRRIAKVAQAIAGWISSTVDDASMWRAHSDVSRVIVDAERAGVPTHYISRMMAANGDLVSALSRIQTIRNTSFIRAGYVLMQLLVGVVLVILIVADFPSVAAQWAAPAILALAYSYLILLVRDVDNPFGGAAAVDSSPIENAADTLALDDGQ